MGHVEDFGSTRFYNKELEAYTDAWGKIVDDPEDEVTEDPSEYASWTGKELKAEFDRRNAEREDQDLPKLAVERMVKSDLRAALEADDEASGGAADTPGE